MIKSFSHKGLEDFFYDGTKKGIQVHPLTGKWASFLAVKVSGNWRVIFIFEEGDAFKVNYLDYH